MNIAMVKRKKKLNYNLNRRVTLIQGGHFPDQIKLQLFLNPTIYFLTLWSTVVDSY